MSIDAYRWTYRQHPKRVEDDEVTDKKHPAAKLVLLTLADFVSKGQRHCWPSQALLADLTDMTERQARRCLADLEKQGLITRETRRRKDGSRRSDKLVLAMSEDDVGALQDADEEPEEQPDERAARDADPTGREWSNQPDESSALEPTTENRLKDNNSSTNVSELAGGKKTPPPPEQKISQDSQESGQDLKQFAVAELMERVVAAKKGGAGIHSPTNEERKQFGRMFAQADKDGYEIELLLMAFDYQIAKAAGEVEGEPKAWCGYRTALDRVNEGWRPGGVSTAKDEAELQRLRDFDEETERLLAEARAEKEARVR